MDEFYWKNHFFWLHKKNRPKIRRREFFVALFKKKGVGLRHYKIDFFTVMGLKSIFVSGPPDDEKKLKMKKITQ